MKKMNKSGFTLIELLIVVAIIAILAAIAIPNFLAAQVRAKVTRSKAELATLATALESYMIDNNQYPDDVDPTGWPWYVPQTISTPIAYITSNVLADQFRINAPSALPGSPGLRYRYINLDAEKTGHYTAQAETWFPHPGNTADVQAGYNNYGQWRLSSSGPDQSAGPGFGFGTDMVYDPTNGTVTPGDIIRSQAQPQQQF